jgi:hypothetical protein
MRAAYRKFVCTDPLAFPRDTDLDEDDDAVVEWGFLLCDRREAEMKVNVVDVAPPFPFNAFDEPSSSNQHPGLTRAWSNPASSIRPTTSHARARRVALPFKRLALSVLLAAAVRWRLGPMPKFELAIRSAGRVLFRRPMERGLGRSTRAVSVR